MVTPRPSLLRTLALIIASICAALLICSCAPPRAPYSYISHGQIPVIYRQESGIAGRWDPDRRVIYLSDELYGWTLAHEMAHAADTTGNSFEAICQMVGDVPVPRQMEILRQVRAESLRLGNGPRSGWCAIYNICGPQGVYHLDILANVRALNHLAKK